jgi:transcriptional repressor NrdR
MVCIYCGDETHVINSRHQRRGNQVWRRRKCRSCDAVFTTEEYVDYERSWRVADKEGYLKPFSRDKLFLSLYEACGHRKTALTDAEGLSSTVISKLPGLMSEAIVGSKAIAQVAQVVLNRFDKSASVYYEARHSAGG